MQTNLENARKSVRSGNCINSVWALPDAESGKDKVSRPPVECTANKLLKVTIQKWNNSKVKVRSVIGYIGHSGQVWIIQERDEDVNIVCKRQLGWIRLMRPVLPVTSLSLADKGRLAWWAGGALIKMKEVGEFLLLHRYDTSRASNDQEICRIPNSISGPLARAVGVPVAFISLLVIF